MATRMSFYSQAAQASWIAPLMGAGFSCFFSAVLNTDPSLVGRRTASLIIAAAYLGLVLLGFVLSLVALIGGRRQGVQGVTAPAIVGLVLSSVLLLCPCLGLLLFFRQDLMP